MKKKSRKKKNMPTIHNLPKKPRTCIEKSRKKEEKKVIQIIAEKKSKFCNINSQSHTIDYLAQDLQLPNWFKSYARLKVHSKTPNLAVFMLDIF